MSVAKNIAIFKDLACQKINMAWEGNTQNLSTALSQAIGQMIVDGTLPAEYKFPNENVICQLLGIGRGTLREAYQMLVFQGLIIRSKNGTTVTSAQRTIHFSPLNMLTMNSDLEEIQEYRSMLEVETARLAATRADDGDVRILQDALDNMRLHSQDIDLLAKHDTRFHMQVAQASKNQLMCSALQSTVRLIEVVASYAFQHNESIVQRAIEFHQNLLDAIIQRNPIAASIIMSDHLKDVGITLNYMLEQQNKK